MTEYRKTPNGSELDENIAVLRHMRVIAWLFVGSILGGLCLWAGLFIGFEVFGG